MRLIVFIVSVLALFATECHTQSEEKKIDLSGTWQYALDPSDKGVEEAWFNKQLSDSLSLPGSLTTNGIGNDITLKTPWTGQIVDSSFYKKPEYAKFRRPGNIKIPFWLQPVKYYKGAAWYQKEVVVPDDWKGKSIELYLERCHWESHVWVDNVKAGMQNSLGTAHKYDLTGMITPGKHRLTVCIDNRVKDIDPGINSHSISDHTQTNWNGMIGQLYLEARPLVKISNVQVFPDVSKKNVVVKIHVNNKTGKTTLADLKLTASNSGENTNKATIFEVMAGENTLQMVLDIGNNLKVWSEFSPEIYTLKASLKDKTTGDVDTQTTTFGMREFKTIGKQFMINGRPTFLRGTLECAIFPKTGYPPTNIDDWLRIFNICRAHGLNHMRFHSWCPPEAAFEAADQTGFYLQVECSSWANQSTTIGDGKPFDKYLYKESQRMIDAYGNHPSFCMMAYGNEPGGANQVPFLTKFVNFWKEKDSRRVYTTAAGWPLIPESDYLSSPTPRIQAWGQELNSIINSQPPRSDYDWSDFNSKYPQPVISHEIGQWCAYPNFKEIKKYDGVLKARNFEIFRETLKNHGMEQLADSFLLASGKLQALCYKADIEAALRTKNFGGFQLLDLHDFPGQGTALVGVLDAFWDEKGYITAAEYSHFCNSTVPLVRLKKFIYTNSENLSVPVEVAHFGKDPLIGVTPSWSICNTVGDTIASGNLPQTDIALGNCISLGKINVPLNTIGKAEEMHLKVTVDTFSNSWDIFVYPEAKAKIEGAEKIHVVQRLDPSTKKYLQDGGSVLLTLKKGTLPKDMGGNVKIGFSSIFWNTAWTRGQAPHTLGVLVDPDHPAFNYFPTEYHSNWQWWDAMSHSGAINLMSFSSGIKPIVRVIDDWFTNRPLALVFEAKVGKGKILISGIDFVQDFKNRPEAQQFLFSLKKYMASEKFQPSVEVPVKQVEQLYR